jgi:hypothetical protein
LKALLITPYYNCVTECILLYYKEKIDALVFMEVDTITVSRMVEKYHLTNILCLSYEEYMLRNDIHIINTDLYDLNIPFSYSENTDIDLLSFSTAYNEKYKRNISKILNKKKIDLRLVNYKDRQISYDCFFIFKDIQSIYKYFVYINKKEKNNMIYTNQYCYYLSWCKYFFDDKIIYTNHTILLNILYSFLSENIQQYIKERIVELL